MSKATNAGNKRAAIARLIRWGRWHQEHAGYSGASQTPISRAMRGALPSDGRWCSSSYRFEDDVIDMDRLVAALPANLQKVVIAEYVTGGNVSDKTTAANVPVSTYYRHLDRALSMVSH